MTAEGRSAKTVQIYQVDIQARAAAIWAAITKSEWTNRYGYKGFADYDLRPGGAYRVTPNEGFSARSEATGLPCPDVTVYGEVVEARASHKLVTTCSMLIDPNLAAEGFTKVTYDIKEVEGGFCPLTVTHDVTGAPNMGALVAGEHEESGAGGGWSWILSDLKSLLETGTTLAGRRPRTTKAPLQRGCRGA